MKDLDKKNSVIVPITAITLFLMTHSLSIVQAAEDVQEENIEIEEVVVEGSRLQGSAQAVLDERKNQAFVADILGSEQISRTGDSDAASALRRVTGLTLLDGKYIYIRGLGERYSSTLLNGSTVPSPDPTRSVLPLDLFPATIIESLYVQKSYSANLPAHFAGGNVDIRTKSIPSETIFKIGGKLGINFDNDDSVWYEGGADDDLGSDDGTRALPASLQQAFETTGLSSLTNQDSIDVVSALNRNIDSTVQSIDPDYGFNITYGDKKDFDSGSSLGFIGSISYKNEWQSSQERNVNNLAKSGGEIRVNEFSDGPSTEQKVKWSGLLNVGFDLDTNHHIELNNIFLKDTKNRIRDRQFENTNTINEVDESRRKIDVIYEERELVSHQLKGSHNFSNWSNLGVDWYYSLSNTERYAPGGFEATFRIDRLTDASGNVTSLSQLARDINTTYSYQFLEDEVINNGINLSFPIYLDTMTLELKTGADFVEKTRDAESLGLVLQTFSIPSQYLSGSEYSQILSDSNLAQADYSIRLDDSTSNGDKYQAATLNDAYYFMVDMDLNNNWRIVGGVRYEDFRQVSVPFQPHSPFFSVNTQELINLPLTEDEFFPALAVTYIVDNEMQYRFNYSKTTIRPDFRDVSSSFYIDPLTEFLVRGSTSIQSSDVTNVDFRWEWYLETGENLSVALFWKDITNPIEQIELPSATEGAPQLLTANASEGNLYGIEIEFLKDLSFIDDAMANYFITGNVTFSNSDVNICSASDNNSCLFEQQLKEALNTDESVTSVITNNSRRLIGHSEWVANVQFGWDSLDNDHSATLVYNVFGPRIIIPGVNGFEDAEEESFNSLDLIYTWYPSYDTTLKFQMKNLLGESKIIEQEGISILSKTKGSELSVQFSMNF
jgi:outer membrane receptor protein involved in Fe transport